MLKTIRTEEAVGKILAHDITEIRPGEFKGRAFKKGHRICDEDLCHLQRLGKRHIYVIDQPDDYLHEDNAVKILADAFCGPGVGWDGEPAEGKLKLRALQDGLLTVRIDALARINLLGEVMCATLHHHTMVRKRAVVAATRAIPLLIRKEIVENAVDIAGDSCGILEIKPLRKVRVGILITGNEISEGLIPDRFEGILRQKLTEFGALVLRVEIAPDDPMVIREHLLSFIEDGMELILTTGGMSVDPDDVTRAAVQNAGGSRLLYGAPVLPGAMFMLAYIGHVPILGVPACGIYHKTTILDLILPRILAGDTIERADLAAMGHGGLCLDCPECRFPICPFGK